MRTRPACKGGSGQEQVNSGRSGAAGAPAASSFSAASEAGKFNESKSLQRALACSRGASQERGSARRILSVLAGINYLHVRMGL
jgi:hypothetical protein